MEKQPRPELASLDDLVGRSTVDGVPVLFAPREGTMISAGIIFRVGRVDEILATSGITHLVEHLAVFAVDDWATQHGGETTDTYTHFFVSGTEEEVVAFLNAVCVALHALPTERIEAEKRVLRIEANGRGGSASSNQRSKRFGAQGFGLAGHIEVGLMSIGPEVVLDWARTRFTRQNAVVWSTTAQPLRGLTLPLPDGEPHALRPPPAVVIDKPAYFIGDPGGVFMDAVVRRSAAASVFAHVASRALLRALRKDGGLSYHAGCEYHRLDSERALVSLMADSSFDHHEDVSRGIIEVLEALHSGIIEESDLEHARQATWRAYTIPSLGASLVVSTALAALAGEEPIDPRIHAAELEAVTADQVAEVAGEVWEDLLAQVPEGDLGWAGLIPVPSWSEAAVRGSWHPLSTGDRTGFAIGNEGVSFESPEGITTVLYQDCAAYFTYPDGARTLVGNDGFQVHLEPTLYVGVTDDVISAMDAAVPAAAFVTLPARQKDEIPIPLTHAPAALKKGLGVWAFVLSFPVGILAFFMIMATSADMIHLSTPDADGLYRSVPQLVGEWIMCAIVVALCLSLAAAYDARRSWNRAYLRG